MPHRREPDKSKRMLRRRTGKARFFEPKGTPPSDARLPAGIVELVLEQAAEVCGIRQTGYPCRVDRGTVDRYGRLVGAHAETIHDELVGLFPRDGRGPVR